MSRTGLATGLVLVMAVMMASNTGVAAAATASPGDAMVDVIVVMRSKADLRTVSGASRAARLASVERTLRVTADRAQASLLALLRTRQAAHRVDRIVPLWIANEVKIRADQGVIAELTARPDVLAVRPDRTITAPVAQLAAPPQPNLVTIGAPAMWDLGYTGQGVVVANLDTGVDVSHPDLASRFRGGTNSWYDPNGQHPTTPTDISGHGTQTMGVIVGGDAGGTSIGVAPGAQWIAAKIFNDQGVAQTSKIHQAFQWLLDPDGNPATPDAPNVVNNSWSTAVAGCDVEFQPDLSGLRAAGIVPVFAAGNYGPLAGTTYGPAGLPEALAVGSVDDADVVDASSSRGPSACAQTVSPALVAPGVGIRTSDVAGGYTVQTGTSLSAPHVAGGLALLLCAFPGLSADQQESALTGSAEDLGPAGVDNDYGYGRLDVPAAYDRVGSSPDFTLSAAPAAATVLPGGTATYSVSVGSPAGFTGAVSLSVTGLPSGQASATFAPSVISGGTGSAQLTVTTTTAIAPGSYALTITGTAGPTVHSTTATLLVTDFTISAAPASVTVLRGRAARFTVSVGSLAGFSGPVRLSRSALPYACRSHWSLNPVVAAGSSVLTIKTTAGTPRGTFRITVIGRSGGRVHKVTITVTVR
ncbi:MAG: S8 family serine peptidase [Actinomycetota bacterium]|nr:S8 family serine peptidase [Actinomycetota bacterium]